MVYNPMCTNLDTTLWFSGFNCDLDTPPWFTTPCALMGVNKVSLSFKCVI
jgi:hypothetical protein